MAEESGENALWIGQREHLSRFIQEGTWREGSAGSAAGQSENAAGRALPQEGEVEPISEGESPPVRLACS